MDIITRVETWYAGLPEDRQRRLVTAAFLLLHVLIWLVLFQSLWFGDKHITDTPIYYEYAGRMTDGMLPYRDFASEYPPLAMLLFLLPRLLSGNAYGAFVSWFELEMLLADLAIVLLISLAVKRLGDRISLVTALGLYSLFLVSNGSIVQARFDMAAAAVIMAALTAFACGRRLPGWALLGLGVMTKMVPALIAPLFLVWHWRRGERRELWQGPLVALAATAIVALPFLVASPGGFADTFLYHAERPLQIESTWASPLLGASKLFGYQVRILNSFGSHNVFSPLADVFAFLSGPATLLLLLVVYVFYWRYGFSGEAEDRMASLFYFAAIGIAAFIVLGKVFSPQFLIWLLPLMPLTYRRAGPGRRRCSGRCWC